MQIIHSSSRVIWRSLKTKPTNNVYYDHSSLQNYATYEGENCCNLIFTEVQSAESNISYVYLYRKDLVSSNQKEASK